MKIETYVVNDILQKQIELLRQEAAKLESIVADKIREQMADILENRTQEMMMEWMTEKKPSIFPLPVFDYKDRVPYHNIIFAYQKIYETIEHLERGQISDPADDAT